MEEVDTGILKARSRFAAGLLVYPDLVIKPKVRIDPELALALIVPICEPGDGPRSRLWRIESAEFKLYSEV